MCLNLRSGIPGGGILGDGWSLAWRVYDAQYWGVPQRRKRIYLVADFAGERAPEILFEREGVRGNPAQSGAAREGTAADVEGGAGGSDRVRCLNPWDCQSKRQHDIGGVYPTLQAYNGGGGRQDGVVYALQGNGIDRADTAGCNGCGWRVDEMYTLNTIDRPAVCFQQNQRDEVRNMGEQAGALTAQPGIHNQNYLCYPETARALTARHDSSPCADRGMNVVCYEGQNVCTDTERSFTLQAGRMDQQHIPSVVYDARGNGDGKTVPTLTGDHQNRVTDYTAVCVGNGQLNQTDMGDKTGALNCMHDQQAVVYPGVGITSPQNGNNPQPGAPAPSLTNDSRNYLVHEAEPPRKYIVRRLTPTECARLQGFPDDWCEGLGGSDSAIYKAYGNGLALPCAYDVMQRIARFVEREKEEPKIG